MNRILSATAAASLLVLSAQAAFAADSTTAKIATPAASTAAVSVPAPVQVRPAVRIPGTFDLSQATQATIDQLYVLIPALSGNG